MLFSSALMKHKLTFTKLTACMQHLTLAATWSEGEWGYIRNKGVELREGILRDISDQLYMGTLNNQPVAMFALFNHKFHPELQERSDKLPQICELMYVYVDEGYRGLGFGRQIIDEAKRVAKEADADLILLDTLNPGLNQMYIKQGAEVVCENRVYSYPSEMLTISL